MSQRAYDALSEQSRPEGPAPQTEVEWSATGHATTWWHAPEWVSCFGTPAWDRLGGEARRRLSLHEARNFFSINIHGERWLIAGIAERLYDQRHPEWSRYLHHFLDEENRHMAMFGTFCDRFAGGCYPDRLIALGAPPPPETADVLFFARVLIFEEVVDALNRSMAADARLAPLVRSIHALHHEDESRHLGFGRIVLRELAGRDAAGWSSSARSEVASALTAWAEAMRRSLCNPAVYRDAGLADVPAVREAALEAMAPKFAALVAAPLRFLAELGLVGAA